ALVGWRLARLTKPAQMQSTGGAAGDSTFKARGRPLCSLRRDAAVDDKARAGHKGGIVRGEKDDAFGDIGGRSHAPDRSALDDLPPSHLDIVGAEIARPSDEHLVAHIGVDRPGMDRIDPDAVSLAGKFERGGLG